MAIDCLVLGTPVLFFHRTWTSDGFYTSRLCDFLRCRAGGGQELRGRHHQREEDNVRLRDAHGLPRPPPLPRLLPHLPVRWLWRGARLCYHHPLVSACAPFFMVSSCNVSSASWPLILRWYLCSHLDHVGALPYFTEVCGYSGPVYMTVISLWLCYAGYVNHVDADSVDFIYVSIKIGVVAKRAITLILE